MRRIVVAVVVVAIVAVAALAVAVPKSTMELKAGDEVFACNCGDACDCKMMAKKAGNCTCGKPMVKASVVAAEAGKVSLKAEGWDKARSFKTAGKFMCDCGEKCDCDAIGQKAGKCPCGKEMKKVAKAAVGC